MEDVTDRLSAKYKLEKDTKSNEKLSSEVEQIEIEFTDAQNRVQKVRDELRSREVYSKFIDHLNKEQPVLLDEETNSLNMQSVPKTNSLSRQSEQKIMEKRDVPQSPICETIEQQSRLSGRTNLENPRQVRVSEPSRVSSTMMLQYAANHHPSVLDAVNPGILQTHSLMGNDAAIQSVPNTMLIGQDMWKQLKRVNVPIFSGDKKTYQNWKAAFTACVDQAPATAEYKLLQLKQCLAGEA